MTPKQWIRYIKRLEKRGMAICDGSSDAMGFTFDMLYPFFILTGMGIFMWILWHWKAIKEKVTRRKRKL